MIHVITLEPHEAEDVDAISHALYTAFGVGAELTAQLALPEAAIEDGQLDVDRLLSHVEQLKIFADDKVLYLVQRPFRPRPSLIGPLPTHGLSEYGKERAVMSGALVTQGTTTPEARALRLSKLAVHSVGHLFDLHHCVDLRCAMAVPWGVNFAQSSTVELCAFCRDKSERRMKNNQT